MNQRRRAFDERWLARFLGRLADTLPSVDRQEAIALASSCDAGLSILSPEQAADVIADLLYQVEDDPEEQPL